LTSSIPELPACRERPYNLIPITSVSEHHTCLDPTQISLSTYHCPRLQNIDQMCSLACDPPHLIDIQSLGTAVCTSGGQAPKMQRLGGMGSAVCTSGGQAPKMQRLSGMESDTSAGYGAEEIRAARVVTRREMVTRRMVRCWCGVMMGDVIA